MDSISSNDEILKKWISTSDQSDRLDQLKDLKYRGLFPENIDFDNAYGLYPDVADKDFLIKLFHKREYSENKMKALNDKSFEDIASCNGSIEFQLSPVQRFVSTYLSAKTPYNSALLYHGVGVGKTCAAISIAEAYLYTYPRNKVMIVAPPNIQPNFSRTIFDINNVVISPDATLANKHNGCTGTLYLELTGCMYEKDIRVIERKVKALIRERYEIMGYGQLDTHIKNVINKVSAKRVTEALQNEFSGRCMIIDEAHNLRDVPAEKKREDIDSTEEEVVIAAQGKKLTPTLLKLLEDTEDMKLILLTATPMYNSYLEIIYLLNLLLTNDKKTTISSRDIFDSVGGFLEGGVELLGSIIQAYVSFMRGETPVSFPIRLNPHGIKELRSWPTKDPAGNPVNLSEIEYERLLKLPLTPVVFPTTTDTYTNYSSFIKKYIEAYGLGLDSINTLVQSGNWIYPSVDDDLDFDTRLRDKGFDSCFNNEYSLKNFIRYKSNIGKPDWLLADNLKEYSPKASFLINRIRNTEGPLFIYSRFIKSGALPLALALEANGYTLWNREDRGLLVDGNQLPDGRQCAKCPAREKNHKDLDHEFVPAKYALLTGSKDISPNNNAAIIAERSRNNYDGSIIKVVIGSEVASEGIDLRFIREIYVFDSWYHLNMMEQVLGRGIRTCSHIHELIPPEKRNCTVYLLVNSLQGNNESADLYLYRVAMMKALQMGKVTRVIKKYALDCNLNISVNYIKRLSERRHINAQQNPKEGIITDINDKNYTNMCDWMECDYTCATPIEINLDNTESGKINTLVYNGKVGNINTLSYDSYTASWREVEVKKAIRTIFQTQLKDESLMMVRLEDLREFMSAIPDEAFFFILYDIVNNKSFRLKVHGKEGYLTYKNGFYLFQPLKIEDLSIPLSLRISEYPVKRDTYSPIKRVVQPEVVLKESDVDRFWQTVVQWSKTVQKRTIIQLGMSVKIPNYVVDVIKQKYLGDNDRIKYSLQGLEMFQWYYYVMKDKLEYRNALGTVLLEYIWDNFLTFQEQIQLIKVPDEIVIDIGKEQILESGKYIRYMSLQYPYKLKYWCNDKHCSDALATVLDKNQKDPYFKVEANIETTGPIYGFIVPREGGYLTFKTSEEVAQIDALPSNGEECKIIQKVSHHLTMLYKIGTILASEGFPDFDLTSSILYKKKTTKDAETVETRQVESAIRYCALKEIILRWMDIMNVSNKRWFYRPISSYKSKHYAKAKKQ